MKKQLNILLGTSLFLAFLSLGYSCNTSTSPKTELKDSTIVANEDIITDEFLHQDIQARLTPDIVLQMLKRRNQEYVNGNLTIRNTSARIRKASMGQFPGAVALSCLDSRVPVEDVFHCGIGDLFVARVAGNIANEDILGSLEYGCKVSGAKVIVVLGHENCGAIKSAIDNVQMGNITALLAKIRPAIDSIKGFEGERTSSNPDFLEAVTDQNIVNTISFIRRQSPVLKEMEENGEIKIVGAEYYMESGEVKFQ